MSDTPKDPTGDGEGDSSHIESPENTPVINHAEADDSQGMDQTVEVQQEQTSTVVNLQDEKRRRGRPRKNPKALRWNPPDPTNDWRDELIRNPRSLELQSRSFKNVRLFLENHEELTGVFAYDLWRSRIVVRKPVKWDKYTTNGKGDYSTEGRAITDEDLGGVLQVMEDEGQTGFSTAGIAEVIQSVAIAGAFNPLTEWLSSLKWDGKARIDGWLTYYLGANPTSYTKLVGAKYLIGAVARAFVPGCKMDNILILEGAQGRKKSTALMTLFGEPYFTDQLGELSGKDASMQMQGIWCVELPELTSLDRSSSRQIKEWLSRRTERFRPPFGRALKEYPRQCVIAGTTNPDAGYLRDSTGARRFWPVAVSYCDIDAIRHDRDQLWAEAVQRYRAGECWWLVEEESFHAVLAQRARYDTDAWHEPIRHYVSGRSHVTINELLAHFGFALQDMGQREKQRVATELTFLGWELKIAKINNRSVRVYVPGENAAKYMLEIGEDQPEPDQIDLSLQQPHASEGYQPTPEETELEL